MKVKLPYPDLNGTNSGSLSIEYIFSTYNNSCVLVEKINDILEVNPLASIIVFDRSSHFYQKKNSSNLKNYSGVCHLPLTYNSLSLSYNIGLITSHLEWVVFRNEHEKYDESAIIHAIGDCPQYSNIIAESAKNTPLTLTNLVFRGRFLRTQRSFSYNTSAEADFLKLAQLGTNIFYSKRRFISDSKPLDFHESANVIPLLPPCRFIKRGFNDIKF